MAPPTSGDYFRTHHLVFALAPLLHSNCTEKVAVAERALQAHLSPIFEPAQSAQPVLGNSSVWALASPDLLRNRFLAVLTRGLATIPVQPVGKDGVRHVHLSPHSGSTTKVANEMDEAVHCRALA